MNNATQTLSKKLENQADVDPQDRAAIIDALYRFGAGMDLRDRDLFESALSAQANSISQARQGASAWNCRSYKAGKR